MEHGSFPIYIIPLIMQHDDNWCNRPSVVCKSIVVWLFLLFFALKTRKQASVLRQLCHRIPLVGSVGCNEWSGFTLAARIEDNV